MTPAGASGEARPPAPERGERGTEGWAGVSWVRAGQGRGRAAWVLQGRPAPQQEGRASSSCPRNSTFQWREFPFSSYYKQHVFITEKSET